MEVVTVISWRLAVEIRGMLGTTALLAFRVVCVLAALVGTAKEGMQG